MATMNEFFQALGMFEGATKEYAIKQGINDATTAVQEMSKMQDLDIDQKYAMQKQAATSLQAQLSGLGAPQTTIASAVGAIAPPDITTVEGARQLASLATTPDERLKYSKVAEDNAKKLGELSLATKEPAMKAEQDFTAKEAQKNRDLQWAIANIDKKTNKESASQILMQEVEDRRQNINDALTTLKTKIGENGTFEVFGSQNQDIDRLVEQVATDMAKLMDPKSVARPSEVESVKQNLIKSGFKNRNSTALQILENFQGEVDRRANSAYTIRGLPVPKQLRQTSAAPAETKTPGQNTSGMIPVRMPDGSTGTVHPGKLDAFLLKYPGSKVKGQ